MNFLTVGVFLAISTLVVVQGWDHHRHPKYEFSYGVKDLATGDIKGQWEQRDGDRVRGSYALQEADGSIRVVEYYADAHSGFRAIVKKIGRAHHSVVHHGNAHNGHGKATSYINVNHY